MVLCAHSQIDYYQHHYLVCLLLLILSSAVFRWPNNKPEQRSTTKTVGTPNTTTAVDDDDDDDDVGDGEVERTTMKLVAWQVAFVYLCTTVAKLHRDFISGAVLRSRCDWFSFVSCRFRYARVRSVRHSAGGYAASHGMPLLLALSGLDTDVTR
jgi:hypothetical protein